MAMSALVVHVEDGPDSTARVRLAARLAVQLEALLIGVAAQDVVPPVTARSLSLLF
jgi:hypothetical protein